MQVFNLRLTRQHYPTVVKEAAIVSYLKKAIMPLYGTLSVVPFLFSVIYLNCLNSLLTIVLLTLNLIPTNMASQNLNLQLLGNVS
jgi:hypothetical protein